MAPGEGDTAGMDVLTDETAAPPSPLGRTTTVFCGGESGGDVRATATAPWGVCLIAGPLDGGVLDGKELGGDGLCSFDGADSLGRAAVAVGLTLGDRWGDC